MPGKDFKGDVMDVLGEAESGDTFAARIEAKSNSIGPRTEYVRVETVYNRDRRPSDRFLRFMKIEMRRNPSADFSKTHSVLECDGVIEIHRLGPSNITIHAVSENTNVDYSSDRTLISMCDECGNTGIVPVDETDLPAKTILTDSGDSRVTTCCSASWTCTLS